MKQEDLDKVYLSRYHVGVIATHLRYIEREKLNALESAALERAGLQTMKLDAALFDLYNVGKEGEV